MESATNSIYEARCSGADLIASGTLIPFDDEETEISIPTGSEDKLVLKIYFMKDEENKASRSKLSGDPNNQLIAHLTFYNLKSPFGGGPLKPVHLWKTPEEEILLMIRVFTQRDYPPVIHFSFYRKPLPSIEGKEVKE